MRIFIGDGLLTNYDFRETHLINYLAKQVKEIGSTGISKTLDLEVLKLYIWVDVALCRDGWPNKARF